MAEDRTLRACVYDRWCLGLRTCLCLITAGSYMQQRCVYSNIIISMSKTRLRQQTACHSPATQVHLSSVYLTVRCWCCCWNVRKKINVVHDVCVLWLSSCYQWCSGADLFMSQPGQTGRQTHCVLNMSIHPSVHPSVCWSIKKLVNEIFYKWMKWCWRKLVQVVRGVRHKTIGVRRSKVKVVWHWDRSQKSLWVRYLVNGQLTFN